MCLSAAAPADNPETALPAKKVVKQVQVIVSGPAALDEGRIRANMATREGGPFSEEIIERDIKSLYGTGAIENVDITTQDVSGGVKVVVKVVGRGAIGEVVFRGNSKLKESKLKDKAEVKAGDPVDDAKLFLAQNKIREAYTEKGFGDVTVSYKTEAMPQKGTVRVVFNIAEGQKGLINGIRFEGLTAVKETKLRQKMSLKVYHSYNPMQWFGKGGNLDNDTLQEDIRVVERAVQDQGYVYAKVVQVRREPVKAERVDLVFVIDEGKRYSVAEVTLDGIKVFTVDQLRPALTLSAGDRYSATSIAADEKMISDYYGSRGYADARVETSVLSGGPDTVKIQYRVTEGEKSFIRLVNIQGNNNVKDRVIRRELAFAPGEEFNTVRIAASKNRLENMGYFSQVDFRNNPTGTPGYKDVDITVGEKATGSVQLGAGFSSIDNLVGFLDVTETDFDIMNWRGGFKGGGERFNVNARYGTQRRDFSVSWVNPFLFGKRLSFGVDVFYRDLFYLSDYFDQRNAGGSISFRKPLGEHSYAELTYTAQNVEVRNIAANASEIIKSEAGTYMEQKVELSWVHDTRDNVFLTRKGHKVNLTAGIIGGDVQAYTLSAQGSKFFLLPYDMILSFEGEVRSVSSTGDGEVPIFERLFLGGANNLRGFDFRDVGPKDLNGEPVGGTASFYATAELTFPIIEKVRGAFFYDVGKVTGGPGTFGGGLNSNIGIGARLFMLPTGPIRLDFGIPVTSDSFNDSSGRFQFNIGYKF
jgi:outer membrane protein insertion porin family